MMLASVLLACPGPPDIVWTGENVALGTEDEHEICGGTLPYLDRRTGELTDRFGSSDRTINYYFRPDDDDPFCSDGAVGCTFGADVYARHIPLQHELVHAARASRLPPVFEEGLATHWGDPWPIDDLAPREVLPDLLEAQQLDTVDEYARAAHFMAFLSERGGIESLLELDELLDPESSNGDIEDALAAIYGAGLPDLVDEYQSYPECRGIVDMRLHCQGDASLLSQGVTDVSVTLDCEDALTVGPYYGTMFIDAVVELGPTVSGTRFVAVTGESAGDGGRVLLRSCMACSEPGFEEAVLVLEDPGTLVLPEEMLPAGRYAIRYMAPVEAGPTTLGLHVG